MSMKPLFEWKERKFRVVLFSESGRESIKLRRTYRKNGKTVHKDINFKKAELRHLHEVLRMLLVFFDGKRKKRREDEKTEILDTRYLIFDSVPLLDRCKMNKCVYLKDNRCMMKPRGRDLIAGEPVKRNGEIQDSILLICPYFMEDEKDGKDNAAGSGRER